MSIFELDPAPASTLIQPTITTSSPSKEYALIVAAGKGTRVNNTVPKQFMLLNRKPVLLYTIEAFVRYSENISIILVLAKDDFETWENIRLKFNFTFPLLLQHGGDTRFQSVRNGLSRIESGGLVAIHDGVRPLVSEDIIGASFRLASIHRCAIASVRLKESIRMNDQNNTKAVDRSRFKLIQTPQTFDVGLIKDAYDATEDTTLTDDASVAERAGNVISLFEGSYENIKITTPEDFVIAEALLAAKNKIQK